MYINFHWNKLIQCIWFMWSSPARKEGLALKPLRYCFRIIGLLHCEGEHRLDTFSNTVHAIFKFFLKSKKLKLLMILPKSHSTVTLTERISALYPLIFEVSIPWRNGACRCTRQRVSRVAKHTRGFSSWGICILLVLTKRVGPRILHCFTIMRY